MASFLSLRNKDAKEIVCEALDLNDLEKSIYFNSHNTEKTIKDLVKETGRTRSVVQRAVQDLMKKDLLLRDGKVDKTVYYVYTAVPFDKVKQQVADIVDQWYNDIMDILQ